MSHRLLLHNLAYYDIKDELIKAFLLHREETVAVDGQHSSPADVSSGVPQSSVIGPLLFLL